MHKVRQLKAKRKRIGMEILSVEIGAEAADAHLWEVHRGWGRMHTRTQERWSVPKSSEWDIGPTRRLRGNAAKLAFD